MIEFNATFLVAMLSFVVFIFIMNAIFYNPILSIMRKRESYINSNYEDAKKYSAKAEEFLAERNDKLNKTKIKCRNNVKNVVNKAQEMATEKTRAAKDQAKSKIQSKKEALLKDEQVLKNAVKSTVVNDLANSITSKFLGNDVQPQNVNYEIVNKVMD